MLVSFISANLLPIKKSPTCKRSRRSQTLRQTHTSWNTLPHFICLATKPLEAYGTLKLKLKTSSSSQMIVQLTDEKEVVLREQIGAPGNEFFFEHLEPLNYKLRVIYDGNKNGVWDTGNYLKRIQPEPVSYFPELLGVRANWEFEETFILPN